MKILAIETSCDETSCAVVTQDGQILSNVISSQVQLHAPYGGVVPELAARTHVEHLPHVLRRALDEAGMQLADCDAIAATQGPGLIGCLLTGFETAKALALAAGKPFIPVNHIAGHLHSIFIGEQRADENFYPYLGLVVSGGHTSLIRVDAPGEYRELGQTLDDAAGEVFDKVARMLELGHPGGPLIDRLAANGDPQKIHFTRPMLNSGDDHFSFSGLKTAVRNYIEKTGRDAILHDARHLAELCASFQAAVVDTLLAKTKRALEREQLRRLAIVGGVACNRMLRGRAVQELPGVAIKIPAPLLCTDNAAMIAAAAFAAPAPQQTPDWGINADANLALPALR